MKFIPISLIASAAFLSSCQNQMNNSEAEARHEEMKQILTSYDNKVSVKQSELEKQLIEQEKLIAKLSKIVEATQKDLKEWNSADNKDAVMAALRLKDIPNREIKRSVMTILGQLKGPAAEKGIIEIVLNTNDSSTISSGLSTLKTMGSKKIREVCLSIMEKGDPRCMRYAFQSLTPVARKEDVKKVIEIAKNISPATSDYDLRYCWTYLMKFFLEKGDKDCLPVVVNAVKEFGKDNFNNKCWGTIIISKLGTAEQFKVAEKAIRPFLNNKSVYMDSSISYWFRENARVEMIPAMELLSKKASGSYKRYFLEGFANMVHPRVAKRLVEEYDSTKDSSTKSTLERAFKAGFPGVMWFEKDKKAKLIPEKELDDLIKKFDKE